MSEKKFLDRSEINKILNIVVSSSKIKTLKYGGKFRRPGLHCVIFGMKGTAKSTILSDVGVAIKQDIHISVTKSSLQGSIDRNTAVLNSPVLWDCRNSCLLIDEFSFDLHDYSCKNVMDALLSAMEIPVYSRTIGGIANIEVNEKEGDLYLKAKNGKIKCKTRFTLIINTMRDLTLNYGDVTEAFLQRCLAIPHYPEYNEVIEFARNKLSFFEYEPYKVKPHVVISDADYNYIIDFVAKFLPTQTELVLRTIGDLCRVFAVLGKHDDELYKLIINMKKVVGR